MLRPRADAPAAVQSARVGDGYKAAPLGKILLARGWSAPRGGAAKFEPPPLALAQPQRRPPACMRGVACRAVAGDQEARRSLYPLSSAPPLQRGYLQVSPQHRVHFSVHGAADGIPALVVHGGPGAGCFPNHM